MFLDGIANYVILGIAGVGAANVILAQTFSVSTTAFWTTLVYIQMTSLVPLMSVNWANFVSIFIGKISRSVNFEFSFIPNVIFNSFIAPAGQKTMLEPA